MGSLLPIMDLTNLQMTEPYQWYISMYNTFLVYTLTLFMPVPFMQEIKQFTQKIQTIQKKLIIQSTSKKRTQEDLNKKKFVSDSGTYASGIMPLY